jgi:hypothetical protein
VNRESLPFITILLSRDPIKPGGHAHEDCCILLPLHDMLASDGCPVYFSVKHGVVLEMTASVDVSYQLV